MSLTLEEKIELAVSDNLSFENAVILSIEDDREILRALARNPRTPLYILIQLASYQDWRVSSRVAGNSSTPVFLLERLVNDDDGYVRQFATSTLRRKVGSIKQNSKLKSAL